MKVTYSFTFGGGSIAILMAILLLVFIGLHKKYFNLLKGKKIHLIFLYLYFSLGASDAGILWASVFLIIGGAIAIGIGLTFAICQCASC